MGNYDKPEIMTFAKILDEYNFNKKILKLFQSDYIEWLNKTVSQILGNICSIENPDIIVFPEYSLPFEVSQELEENIIKYSENRVIVGGLGSISNDSSNYKNRFFFANNKKIVKGEKIVPSPYENKIIMEGNGPVLHNFFIDINNEKIELSSLIAMCSDFFDKGSYPGSYSRICEKEYNEKGINNRDVDIEFVPAFTTTSDEMASIAEISTNPAPIRKSRIIALSNCSFFGKSRIWCGIYEKSIRKSTPEIEPGISACIVAQIPYPKIQILQPKPKQTTDNDEISEIPVFEFRRYLIKFKNEKDSCEVKSIHVDTEDFMALVHDRLNKALTFCALASIVKSSSETKQEVLNTIKVFKELQKQIENNISLDNIIVLNVDHINYLTKYLAEIIYTNPYNKIINALSDLVDNKNDKINLDKIKKNIGSKMEEFQRHLDRQLIMNEGDTNDS